MSQQPPPAWALDDPGVMAATLLVAAVMANDVRLFMDRVEAMDDETKERALVVLASIAANQYQRDMLAGLN